MKRLLFVVNNLTFFISHRLELGLAARKSGWEVHVAAPAATDEITAKIRTFGFHPIRMKRVRGHFLEEFSTLLDLFRLYRRLQPNVVHLVGLKPVLYGGWIARLTYVPRTICAITGLGYLFIANSRLARILQSMTKLLLRFVLRGKSSKTIFQNADDFADFTKSSVVQRTNAVIIKGAGVDLDIFRVTPEPPGIPIVVLVGRMLWHKGVREFVEAARQIHQEKIQARFVLVGDVDEVNPAGVPKASLVKWSQEGVVEWWGHREDVAQILQNAHIACLPSFREGLPKTLLEAAASGRPIVTTDCPGCREVVLHNKNGFLVPVGDERELAHALRRLIGDAGLRQQMGLQGRVLAEKEFGIEKVIEETMKLYASSPLP